MATARVSAECPNCPAVDLIVSDYAPRIRELDGTTAWGPLRIAHGTDRDGMFVEALAIIQDGRLAYIDVWRGDGEKQIDPPLDSFHLLARRRAVPAFFEGQRVRVRPDYHFAQGATGTVRKTFTWEGGGGRSLVHVVDGVDGPILFYWVEFDEGHYDAEGDGPVIEAEIDGQFLESIPNDDDDH